MQMDKLREKISDIITNELFERFESPSAAVIGVQLADRILAIPEIVEALRITRGDVDGLVIVKEMTRHEIVSKFGQ